MKCLCIASILVLVAAPVAAQCDFYCAATVSPPNPNVLICPQGDTPSLADLGITITLHFGWQIPAITIYSSSQCGVTFCIYPGVDGPVDANGDATITGPLFGGGYTEKWYWGTGFIPEPPCLANEVVIRVVSPDMKADLEVNLVDLAAFAMAYPPNAYAPEADMDGNGLVGLQDLSFFAHHYGHSCT